MKNWINIVIEHLDKSLSKIPSEFTDANWQIKHFLFNWNSEIQQSLFSVQSKSISKPLLINSFLFNSNPEIIFIID